MGKAIYFEGANIDLGAPQGMTKEQVYTCPVMVGIDKELEAVSCITCHQFNKQELEILIANEGKCYLQIIGWQPPVCVSPDDLTQQLRPVTDQDRLKYHLPSLDKYKNNEQEG